MTTTALFLIECNLLIERLLCARFLGRAPRQKKPQVRSWRNASFPGEQEAAEKSLDESCQTGAPTAGAAKETLGSQGHSISVLERTQWITGSFSRGTNPALTCPLRA